MRIKELVVTIFVLVTLASSGVSVSKLGPEIPEVHRIQVTPTKVYPSSSIYSEITLENNDDENKSIPIGDNGLSILDGSCTKRFDIVNFTADVESYAIGDLESKSKDKGTVNLRPHEDIELTWKFKELGLPKDSAGYSCRLNSSIKFNVEDQDTEKIKSDYIDSLKVETRKDSGSAVSVELQKSILDHLKNFLTDILNLQTGKRKLDLEILNGRSSKLKGDQVSINVEGGSIDCPENWKERLNSSQRNKIECVLTIDRKSDSTYLSVYTNYTVRYDYSKKVKVVSLKELKNSTN